MFPSLKKYEEFIYSIRQLSPLIESSTLILVRYGATLARVRGSISFKGDIILNVMQVINFGARIIEDYSYEIYQAGEKIYWYDPQPHPQEPSLLATFPHHKHVPPDIKHHRIPAPNLNFDRPNLPFLIAEIEKMLGEKGKPG